MVSCHSYWDQASALVQVRKRLAHSVESQPLTLRVQLGLLERRNLPVAGVEVARKVVNPFGVPSNELMERWKESEGLPIND